MLSPDLRASVERRYDLGVIVAASPLSGGHWNSLLRLETDRGLFVLRLSHPDTPAEGMDYEHALLLFMAQRFSQVPAPLAARDGATWFSHDGRLATLFPHIPGRVGRRDDPPVRAGAAPLLGQLHRAALEFPNRSARPGRHTQATLNWEKNAWWTWSTVAELLEGGPAGLAQTVPGAGEDGHHAAHEICARRSQIAEECVRCRDWIADLGRSGRRLLAAPIHGDYYAGNLLVEGERITAVLDWEECGREWLAWEVAYATWEFCQIRDAHVLDSNLARDFLRSYEEAGGPVSADDFDLMVPFIRCIRVKEVLWALGRAARGGEWDPSYTVHNLLSLDGLGEV